MVHWPEPNIPTPLGPRRLSASLNFSAITSKASSHDTRVNSPFLSYLPSRLRSSGWVRRSWPYITLDRKYPFTQLRPRLTSAFMSPCVATTRPSLVATMTPQPVPQNRQGALFHFSSVAPRSVTRFCAARGVGSPPAAAAMAAASSFRNSRRSTRCWLIAASSPFAPESTFVGSVEHERRGQNLGHHGNGVQRGTDASDVERLDHHHELALRVAAVDLRVGQRLDRTHG